MDLGEGGEASGGLWALPPSPARSQHGVRPWVSLCPISLSDPVFFICKQ